jgi:Dictyostelium (slime mold) repeat
MWLHWQYRGWPPVSRIISGTVYQQTPNGIQHYTAGCGGTTSFLRDVLRAVNIPVIGENRASHACPHFTSEGLYLSHGDDPYSIRSMSEIPTEQLLIDQKTFDAWFGPDVAPEQIKNNIGRRTLQLAIEYLPKYFFTKYCADRSKGLSHADGSVYSNFKPCYSLAELEEENLWERMDVKFSPIITTSTPTIVQKGSYVFVHGTKLCSLQCRKSHSTETEVRLNGVRDPLTPLWVDKEFLYFQVPNEATTGHITVTTRTTRLCGGSAESPETLTILDSKNKCTNKKCDDGNACTIDSCDAATGKCLHVKDTWTCDDGNVCTTDSCIPATGKCMHKNNTAPCDDGNYCTVNDVCSNGRCKGTAGNSGKSCDDGNPCTTGDVCSRGGCKGTARKCDDNNACTIDTCNMKTGACVYTTAYTPMVCNAFDPCTTDTCNASTGCVHTDNGTCGSDCGINSFTVSPAGTTTCAKTYPVFTIKVKNYTGKKNTSGTITLYADAAVAQTWSDVSFPAGQVVTRQYVYASRAHDGGKTVTWTAAVTTPNDPNSANDSKSLTMTVTKCSN